MRPCPDADAAARNDADIIIRCFFIKRAIET